MENTIRIMTNDLKSCPFCGAIMGEVEFIPFLSLARIHHADVLRADENCIGQFITVHKVDTVKEAKDKWNMRKPPCHEAEHDGIGCLGFGKGTHDDEPIDVCMKCSKYTGNITEKDGEQE